MKNLQRIRKSRGLSQSQLSEVSKVKMRNIQFYESGERDINKAQCDNVYKLSLALNVPMEQLLETDKIKREY